MQPDRRHDLWFSVLLTVFAAAVVFESWRMPRLSHLGVHPMSAPGLTPGVLGAVLLALALILLLRSVRAHRSTAHQGQEGTGAPGDGAGDGGALRRTLITLGLCIGYAGGLVTRLPFWVATALFVFAFAAIFGWDRDRPLRSLVLAAILGLATGAVVTLLFQRVFLIRLP